MELPWKVDCAPVYGNPLSGTIAECTAGTWARILRGLEDDDLCQQFPPEERSKFTPLFRLLPMLLARQHLACRCLMLAVRAWEARLRHVTAHLSTIAALTGNP
jgi:hypothetical protein